MEGKAKDALFKFCQENDYSLFAESEKYKDLAIMNNALIIEWLDSVGSYITIQAFEDISSGYNRGFEVVIYDEKSNKNYFVLNNGDVFSTRQEATEAAIKKAVEIFNEKYK